MSKTWVEPEVIDSPIGTGRWGVVIFNNPFNTFEEVVEILMRATGCGSREAYIEAWEAHTYGKAFVHFGGMTECELVAAMIATIGVRTEVRREWLEE